MDGIEGLRAIRWRGAACMMTRLISGFTLATTPRRGAGDPHRHGRARRRRGQDPGRRRRAAGLLRARPAGAGPFPIVLVIEEIFGVHEYIKDICRRLAKLGYLAVAPELYARIGDLSKMTDARAIVRDVISKAPDAQVHARPRRRRSLGRRRTMATRPGSA